MCKKKNGCAWVCIVWNTVSSTLLNNYRNGKILILSQWYKHHFCHMKHFNNYSTWWHLTVFQTVQTHAQSFFFYTNQYFLFYLKFQSTGNSITQQTNCMLAWGKIWVACYFWMALYMSIMAIFLKLIYSCYFKNEKNSRHDNVSKLSDMPSLTWLGSWSKLPVDPVF